MRPSRPGDQDALRVDVHPVTLGIEPGNRLAQRRQATCRGVARVACGQGSLAGFDDGRGSGEVRLADLQVDHVMPGCLQFVGPRQQRHDMKGFDGATARTVGLGHGLLSNGSKMMILPMHGNERVGKAVVNRGDNRE